MGVQQITSALMPGYTGVSAIFSLAGVTPFTKDVFLPFVLLIEVSDWKPDDKMRLIEIGVHRLLFYDGRHGGDPAPPWKFKEDVLWMARRAEHKRLTGQEWGL